MSYYHSLISFFFWIYSLISYHSKGNRFNRLSWEGKK